jgi:DNA-binding transcriptional regulator/RsmH inhibitor MraZ
VGDSPSLPGATAPLGLIVESQCDDKGRVRLPKLLEAFVRGLPDQEFFVTTLDGDTGRIYPIGVWRENEKILAQYKDDPEMAEDLAFYAHYWGGVASLDSSGRLLVPTKLRRKLGIENQAVYLRFFNDGIDIFSEAISEKRLQRAEEGRAKNLPVLRRMGLK